MIILSLSITTLLIALYSAYLNSKINTLEHDIEILTDAVLLCLNNKIEELKQNESD